MIDKRLDEGEAHGESEQGLITRRSARSGGGRRECSSTPSFRTWAGREPMGYLQHLGDGVVDLVPPRCVAVCLEATGPK
jgi:hypothetical protein